MNQHPLYSVILAAGQSSRMLSSLTKVLHSLAGQSLISHVGDTVGRLKPQELIIVTAANGEKVYRTVQSLFSSKNEFPLHHIIQEPALGTGHAVQCAAPLLKGKKGTVLIVYGDTPLIQEATLKDLLQYQQSGLAIAVLGMRLIHPGHYGRLITHPSEGPTAFLQRIVEFKEASEQEKQENLCNSGVMAIDTELLERFIHSLPLHAVKNEYYLTDLVEIAIKQGYKCGVLEANSEELMGINTRADLAISEKILQNRYRQKFLEQGVTLIDPETVYFCHDTWIEPDVTIGPHVYFGHGVKIFTEAYIHPFCHLQEVTIQSKADIGPFARIRGNTIIGEEAVVGNFVEVKNLNLGKNSKIKHLSYIGDTTIGSQSNIGAGVVTCNYDGFNKWPTVIGKEVFVGSNTALIAPISIGDQAVIGASSTITDDVMENSLAISRVRQQDFQGKGQRFRQQRFLMKKPKH